MKKYSALEGVLPKAGAPAQGKPKPTPPNPKNAKPAFTTPPMASLGAPVTPSSGLPTSGLPPMAPGGQGGPITDAMPAAPDAGMMPMPDAGMPPADPMTPPDVGPTPAPDASSLDQLKDHVDEKQKEVATNSIITKNKLEGIRAEIIQNLFEQMKKIGVDPSDPKSLSTFVQNLYQKDPDLYMLFETAFNGLTGHTPPEGQDPGQPPVGIDMSSMMGGGMPSGPGGMLGGESVPPTPMPPDMSGMPSTGGEPPMPPDQGGAPAPGGLAGKFGGISSALGQ